MPQNLCSLIVPFDAASIVLVSDTTGLIKLLSGEHVNTPAEIKKHVIEWFTTDLAGLHLHFTQNHKTLFPIRLDRTIQ